jgi:predicted regulator of Ras-like GTPase activity (Roadblock/LC7/MglB family)
MEDTHMVKKKRTSQDVAAEAQPIAVEETTSMGNLRANLEEIKTYDGVVGYILRNSTSAAIDLKDPTKIIDYAILSSSAHDASVELSGLFNLGEVKAVVVEGKDVKMLSLAIGENKVSVFMEKGTDSKEIYKKLLSS